MISGKGEARGFGQGAGRARGQGTESGELTNHPGYDVVVAGYGLAGECAPSLLARLGHRVCAFERWPTLYGLPRTVSTDGEGTRILDKTADREQALRSSSEIYS